MMIPGKTNVSFIFFDLGGVIDIDFSGNNGWLELKEALHVPVEKYDLFDKVFNEFERQICTTMDIEEMKEILNTTLSLHIPQDFSLLQGFVTRFEANPSLWPLLTLLKAQYRVGLFTMMYPHMLDAIKQQGILPDIDWDIVVDSSKVGYTKFDAQMYDIATHEANVPKEEILLVENSKRHVDTALKYGWQTFLYNTRDIKGSNDALASSFSLHLIQ